VSKTFVFPTSLLQSIANVCAIDETKLIESHNQAASTSVRINPFKKTAKFNNEQKVSWANQANYLSERIEFIKDPLFHAGAYYVQEASSMFLEQAIKQLVDLNAELKVLDLCASPGGKSTLINSLLNEKSFLVSNEVIKTRVGALCENLSKWGQANVAVCNNDAQDFAVLPNYFDLIVVDAPCSGSGLFRKQADAIDHWSEENVEHCAARQKRILADIYSSLKPNGILIYSTCSYSTQENEEIVSWLIEEKNMESKKIQLDNDWNITETTTNNDGYGYRFFPHLTNGEGFFLAAFKRDDIESEDTQQHYRRNKDAKVKQNKDELAALSKFIIENENNEIIQLKENYFLISKAIIAELDKLSVLYLRKKGTLLGEFKGKDFIPHHELALSNYVNKDFSSVDVNTDEALQYLKKSELRLNTNVERGFCLVKFEGHPVGWAKNIGNRFNNYLPKDWRILKDIDN